MKRQFFIANWKSYKTVPEAKEWLEEYQISNISARGGWASGPKYSNDQEIILCPQFPLLPLCHEFIQTHHLTLVLGSQDISPFSEGAYTGAVSGKLLREYVNYVIIGHSERRNYFHETLTDIFQKVMIALSVGMMPIYCISDKEEKIPQGVKIVAYEPLSAIGTGKPDDPGVVESTARFIREKNDVAYILYGGSVTAQNVAHYTQLPGIDGVLIGGASLSPREFTEIIQHA